MRKIKIVNKKLIVFSFVLGLVISGGIAYAASQILASDISYRDGTVESALNDLYSKADNQTIEGTVCMLLSGTKNTVGAKYHCDLGDGELRNFYVLKVNIDDIELIMERNITDTVGSNKTISWSDATSFFDENHPGYNLKQTWITRVDEVKLPDIQTIADVGGITGFDVTQHTDWSYFGKAYKNQSDLSARGNYKWLYDYARECLNGGCSNSLSSDYAYGYWTTELVANSNSSLAWSVNRYNNGGISDGPIDDADRCGVRPVITLSKSKLAG